MATPAEIAAASSCFRCISDFEASLLYLLSQIAGVADPATIAANASCFNCIADKQAAILYLLDQIASGGSGGGTAPGAPVNSVQFNDAGAFGGDAGLTYAKATDTLSSGTVLLGAGSAATPALAFTAEPSSGIFRVGVARFGFTAFGVWLAEFNNNMFEIKTGKVLAMSSGANQRAGNIALIGGTIAVANTTVQANTVVLLTRKTSGGTIGTSITYTVTAGVGFTITSDNILDTSTFTYVLIDVP